jgi:DNA polymerase
MPPRPTDLQREKLQSWLLYYQDIGIRSFYRDRFSQSTDESSETQPGTPEAHESMTAKKASPDTQRKPAVAVAPQAAPATQPAQPAQFTQSVQRLQGIVQGPSLFEAAARVEGDTLERICSDLGDDCTRCKLHCGRNKIVFGTGNARAELMFIGEGPGHDEDIQGLPFVGRAGQLLNQMIEAMGLSRAEVYIANVVKCRPPENRAPEKDEVAACMPYLLRQISAIEPKAIVCLGSIATQVLLGTNKGISNFRGQWFDFRGSKLMPTYHPAYLLRNPHAKPEVWADLKKVMAFLGLKPPKPGQRNAARG